MPLDPKVTVMLDREREIRWTMPCLARLGRLQDAPVFSDLMSDNDARSYYALCAFIWACIVDGPDDFSRPEPDVAKHLDTAEKIALASIALFRALRLAGLLKPEKKTVGAGSPKSLSASANSGQSASSSSGRRVRRSKS